MKPQLEIRNIHPANFLCIDWDKHLEKIESITFESTLRKVCEKYEVTAEQLKGRDRHSNVMNARHAYRFVLHNLFDLKLKQTARQLNSTDHATVIHSLKTTTNLCQTEEKKYSELYDLCYSIDTRFAKKFHEIIFGDNSK